MSRENARIDHFEIWDLRDRVWDPERDQWDIPHGTSRVPLGTQCHACSPFCPRDSQFKHAETFVGPPVSRMSR
eukprot:364364-Chlamydomonas_euryale.AAC.9